MTVDMTKNKATTNKKASLNSSSNNNNSKENPAPEAVTIIRESTDAVVKTLITDAGAKPEPLPKPPPSTPSSKDKRFSSKAIFSKATFVDFDHFVTVFFLFDVRIGNNPISAVELRLPPCL